MEEPKRPNEERRELEKELTRFRQAVVLDPLNPTPHYELGLIMLRSDNISTALREFKICAQLDPENSDAAFNIAYCYQLLGFSDSAILRYEKALTFNPGDSQIWHNLATLYLEHRSPERALECAAKATEMDQEFTQSWLIKSVVEHQLHDYESAEQSALIALKLSPKDVYVISQLGSVLLSKGELDSALDRFNEALKLDTQLPELWSNRGVCLFEADRFEEAERDYFQAIELDHDNPDYHFNLGELLFRIEDFARAEDHFLLVINQSPEDIGTWEYLALMAEIGDIKEAIKRYLKLLELSGDRKSYLKKLARLYYQTGDAANELDIRLRIANIDRFDGQNNIAVAMLYLNRGAPELGYLYLKKGGEAGVVKSNIWRQLAQYFQTCRKSEEELDCISQVIKREPEHKPSWIRLGELALSGGLASKATSYLKRGASAETAHCSLWHTVIIMAIQQRNQPLILISWQNLTPIVEASPGSLVSLFQAIDTAGFGLALAEELISQAHANPSNSNLLAGVSLILSKCGYTHFAEETVRAGLDASPGSLILIRRQFDILEEQLRQNLISIFLTSLPSKVIESNAVYKLRGIHQFNQGDFEAADQCFSLALQSRPDDWEALEGLAKTSLKKNAPNSALAYLEEAMSLKPDSPNLWRLMGRTREALKRVDEAIEAFETSIQLYPRDFLSLFKVGELKFEDHLLVPAKRALLKSAAVHLLYEPTWRLLAELFNFTGEKKKEDRCVALAETARKTIHISPYRLV